MGSLTATELAVLGVTAQGPGNLEQIYEELHAPPRDIPLAEASAGLRSLVRKGLLTPRIEDARPDPASASDAEIVCSARFAMTEQGRDAWAALESLETRPPRRSLFGVWKDKGVNISREDIDEARREMWGNFPRDFPE